jgi:hypothetical protein
MGSYCDNYNGDLHYSSATYYLADKWLIEFGNSGDLEPERARAVCDADWCQILSNYAGGVYGYTYDQAKGAVDFVKAGDVDGCSRKSMKLHEQIPQTEAANRLSPAVHRYWKPGHVELLSPL